MDNFMQDYIRVSRRQADYYDILRNRKSQLERLDKALANTNGKSKASYIVDELEKLQYEYQLYTKAELDYIRNMYPVGCRVELIELNDLYTTLRQVHLVS